MPSKKSSAKYRLSVLMDLSKASEATLTNAVQLAKVIDGDVEVFYIKTPADVVTRDNQLSAMREIHQDNRTSKSHIQNLVTEISRREGLPISVKMAYGNLKNGLREYIENAKPDILVLDKKRSKLMDAVSGVHVLITGEEHKFHSLEDITLGVFDDFNDSDFEIIQDLKKESKEPVRMFSINKTKVPQKENLDNTISYVFSEGTNALDAIASYVVRTNTKLFCIPKAQKSRLGFQNDPTKQVVRKLDVPVLIMQ